jgi:hypothetical protein
MAAVTCADGGSRESPAVEMKEPESARKKTKHDPRRLHRADRVAAAPAAPDARREPRQLRRLLLPEERPRVTRSFVMGVVTDPSAMLPFTLMFFFLVISTAIWSNLKCDAVAHHSPLSARNLEHLAAPPLLRGVLLEAAQ